MLIALVFSVDSEEGGNDDDTSYPVLSRFRRDGGSDDDDGRGGRRDRGDRGDSGDGSGSGGSFAENLAELLDMVQGRCQRCRKFCGMERGKDDDGNNCDLEACGFESKPTTDPASGWAAFSYPELKCDWDWICMFNPPGCRWAPVCLPVKGGSASGE